ncbi:EF-hand domain-containing protein [Roseiconus lacunae]|uniref:EF-hand domain-containing protein n=1 Tax=Roseiconus lacunae TaxID=2605694 RepID=UPI0011F19BA8|nr:EF-hand domain-containing protein [Roseiconus lacunae]
MKRSSKKFWRVTMCGMAGLAISLSTASEPARGQDAQDESRLEKTPRDESRPRRPRGPRDGDPREGGLREGRPGFGGPGGPMRGQQMLLRLPIVAALDADRDGEISESEISNAATALKTLDRNKDGKIDFAELRPADMGPPTDERMRGRGPEGRGPEGRGPEGRGPEGRGPEGRGPEGRGPRDGDEARGRGPGMFRGGDFGRGGDPTQIVDRMMRQDKNDDGLLSEDELPQWMSRIVERADQNDDGKLSRDELLKAMQSRRAMDRRRGPSSGEDTPGGERPRRPPAE